MIIHFTLICRSPRFQRPIFGRLSNLMWAHPKMKGKNRSVGEILIRRFANVDSYNSAVCFLNDGICLSIFVVRWETLLPEKNGRGKNQESELLQDLIHWAEKVSMQMKCNEEMRWVAKIYFEKMRLKFAGILDHFPSQAFTTLLISGLEIVKGILALPYRHVFRVNFSSFLWLDIIKSCQFKAYSTKIWA